MNLSKELREFIALLNSTNVKYVVVGGHAVAFHGYPRFTGDIDFFVERSPENAAKLERVLTDFGFAEIGLKAADFLDPETVVQLGRPPNRIDILTSIDGVEFQEAWNSRIKTSVGAELFFISKQLLVQNKRATGRTQDLADVERLMEPPN
jgi:hypothetical protein